MTGPAYAADAAALDAPHTLTGKRNPHTSVEAARRALGRSGAARHRVLAALALHPRTDEELQRDLRLAPNTQRPRRVELVDLGYVEATTERRRTATGAQSIVWQATEAGVVALCVADIAREIEQ